MASFKRIPSELPKVGWQGVRLFPADSFTSGGLGSAMMAGKHEVWLCHYAHSCARPRNSTATFGEFCRQECAASGVPPACGVNATAAYSGCCGHVSCEQVACAQCYVLEVAYLEACQTAGAGRY